MDAEHAHISADGAGNFKHRNFFRPRKSLSHLLFALSIKRVVDHKFALENLMIAQAELAEAVCDPAQTFARGMRVAWTRIGRAHDFAQQNKRRIAQPVLFQNRIERDVFAIVTKLAIRNVEYAAALDLRPVGVMREKKKLGLRIHRMPAEPRTRHPIDM